MDVNTLRIVAMLVAFGTFLAIVGWACARGNRERFDEAARLPFERE